MLKKSFRVLVAAALSTSVLTAAAVASASPSKALPSKASARASFGAAVIPASAPPVVSSVVSALPSPTAIPGVLTFQAWKALRIEEARLVLERMMMETQIQQMQQTQNAAERSPGERQAVIRTQAAPPALRQAVRGSRTGRVDQRLDAKTDARGDGKVEQARINLEIAQELAITDYLQIYLSQFRTPDALRDVARRMNPEEVAELLVAYQQKAVGLGSVADSSLAASRLCSGAALASPSSR